MNANLQRALLDLSLGRPILVADDEDRENEGDLVATAESATAELVNFFATEGRGLICAALPPERAERLGLAVVSSARGPTPLHGTAFTESVDYVHGTSTGISASDRSATLRALTDSCVEPDDFARPGHVFPLLARAGGVLERPGHTEATVELCRLSGASGVGVLCEVLNPDGTMARGPELQRMAMRHHLVLVTVRELIQWKKEQEILVLKGENP